MSDKQRWLIFSPLGLLLVGLGVSVVGDAITRKSRGAPWFVRGTLGLSLLNAGLSVFGDAVKARVLHELSQQ